MQQQSTTPSPSFLSVLTWTDEQCREYIAAQRWPDGVCCPSCGTLEPYRCQRKTPSKNRVRSFYKCRGCKKQFTATVGTIFEDTKAPLSKWLAAYFLMCASKKGISSHQLHRMLDVTYNTAWYMAHRIRAAMKDRSGPLSGTIEADETYVGGRVRGHPKRRDKESRRRAWAKKSVVFGILERGGRVRTVTMDRASKILMEKHFLDHVDVDDSVLVTDESGLYDGIKTLLPHRTVKHLDEWVTGDNIHTQGIENFWSILKRQLYGTHHHVEARFLDMYADEAAFKHNTRRLNDVERFNEALSGSEGVRLRWRGKGAA